VRETEPRAEASQVCAGKRKINKDGQDAQDEREVMNAE
jgi:hypothetical protein